MAAERLVSGYLTNAGRAVDAAALGPDEEFILKRSWKKQTGCPQW
jgi:hypothetical protein